jgi:peptidoglycan/xylan/chitin deacetylase (PgdA/CDA1 family)
LVRINTDLDWNPNRWISILLCEIAAVYATRIPEPVPSLFPEFLWSGDADGRDVHLTFDDGPHPEWTPRILDMLGLADHKATFFCVGQNVERYPEVFERIQAEGHSWGNHTMQHESGWSTGQYAYLKSFMECEAITQSGLFRPPYGRMTRAQGKAIASRSRIVMWDLLTGDFDQKRSPEQCLKNTLGHFRPGSIAVMHDSQKAAPRTIGLLAGLLHKMDEEGWLGAALDMPTRS